MEVTYQLIEDDYRDGFRTWQTRTAWRRWNYRFGFIVMFGVLVGSLALQIWSSDPELRRVSWFALGFAVLWLIAVRIAPGLQARQQFRRMPSAQAPARVTISDSGMHVESKHSDSHVMWSTYIGWSEGKSVFVLFPQPRIYVPIPKRAFKDEQLSEFREILRRNVGRN